MQGMIHLPSKSKRTLLLTSVRTEFWTQSVCSLLAYLFTPTILTSTNSTSRYLPGTTSVQMCKCEFIMFFNSNHSDILKAFPAKKKTALVDLHPRRQTLIGKVCNSHFRLQFVYKFMQAKDTNRFLGLILKRCYYALN